jgi:hypothetical protein
MNKKEKQTSNEFESFMFDDDETAETEDVTVSAVASDNEDEHCVTQLPGSDCEMECDEDQDWVECDIPVPKQQPKANPDLVPSSLLVARTINGKPSLRLLKVSFDSGGTKTLFNRRCLPTGATPCLLGTPAIGTTATGNFKSTTGVRLEDCVLPEFSRSKKIECINAIAFDAPASQCDVMLGRDYLHQLGMDPRFSTKKMVWMEHSLDMKSPGFWDDPVNLCSSLHQDADESVIKDKSDQHRATEILHAKYEKVDAMQVARDQKHLNEEQQRAPGKVLNKFTKLFDGTLGKHPHRKAHLELEPGAKPVHSKPCAVAKTHEQVFKDELEHLCSIGALERCGSAEWAALTFMVPKKDGRVRWVSDFRALNKVIKRKTFPLPRIQDILNKRKGYEFFAKIDTSMQCCTFELDKESAELCTIVTPHGKCKCCRLPMGIKLNPDVAQEIMEEIFRDMDETDVFIDDVGAFSDVFEAHLVASLEKVLKRLEDNGFTVNPLKCEWAVKETDWLGHWLTPTGLKPWTKKIKAILQMDAPKSAKQVRSFLGAVTCYRDMWPHRSHTLAPQTDLTGKGKFIWETKLQKAFDEMKALVATDTMLRHPDHNKGFEICTDASNHQLGAVIMQEGKPVACYSRKLNSAQRNHTTMEKELLSVVMTLREFCFMLLGANLQICTDHRNLAYQNLNSQRALRWRLFLQEHAPTFHCVKGEKNVVADAFSRLPSSQSLWRRVMMALVSLQLHQTMPSQLKWVIPHCWTVF